MKTAYTGQIKIFSDAADMASILAMAKNPKIHGVTTNPSLMRKANVKDYRSYCKEALSQVKDKPFSFEVFADEFSEMKKQALEIASWGKNIYVKIPITNSKGESSVPLIRELAHSGVKLNVTAVFTLQQTWETAQALKGGPESIISIFAGRIADAGIDPVPLMQAALTICRQCDAKIELLWASTREAFNIVQAELCGCDIITVPPEIISKTSNFGKDLLEYSLDTVKMFKKDAEASGFKL